MKVKLKVFRYNPEKDKKPHFEKYEVDIDKGWTVLDALHEIKWRQDGTLAFRRSCRHEICGSCAMTINGENALACSTQIEDLKTSTITVAPLHSLPVIKDLVVEMEDFFAKLSAIKPFMINYKPFPDKERQQSPEQRKVIDEATNCILCAACTSSCPSYWTDKKYLGPAALLKAYRFIFDSRDDGQTERLQIINDRNGAWQCHTIFNCVEVCPKDINITQTIAEIKKAVVKNKI